ncbi:DUF5677 domain-containing protein [Serratia liquefaciens]|uniref:DUF5677 domain-containing protein n=1 Tax=Serratia liquefaciens TaxID=614 RepID=UPI0021843FEB|nr:DUF5677 domain-containing protein [Serratia liquefaciens]CAI2533325.1 Uncharacterised protein [Serratia liquefaciens]
MGTLILEGNIGLDLEKMLLDNIAQVANERGISIETAIQLVSDKIPNLIAKISDIYKSGLEKNKDEYICYNNDLIKGFESRLYETWKNPLDIFELLIVMCRELGSETNSKFRSKDFVGKSYKLEVLTRLHAHTVHIACEIMQLLKGGYADGAMARWRSMHESAVISRIIDSSSDGVAKKYYLHKFIDDFKFSQTYMKYSDELGFERMEKKDFDAIRERYDELIKDYGRSYAGDNGWAVEIIGKERVTFYDLERFANLSYLRPYYKFSSVRVHLGSKSLDYKLSLSLSEKQNGDEVLIAGPSNEGLFDPMQCTAMSLIDVTVILISQIDNMNNIVFERILHAWNEDLKVALVEASEQLSKKGMEEND